MSRGPNSSNRMIFTITLLLLLGGEWLFFFRNKVFFHFFGGVAGIKDFQTFKQMGIYGIKPDVFLRLQEEPFLTAVVIAFLFADVYVISKIIQPR